MATTKKANYELKFDIVLRILKSKINSLNSMLSDERNVLTLEVLLTVISIASITFLAYTAGEEVSRFLVLPVSAVLFVPFFSTVAYFRGFTKTAFGTILMILVIPILTTAWFVITQLPSREAGILVAFFVAFTALATAIIPYIVFIIVLGVHHYRKYFRE